VENIAGETIEIIEQKDINERMGEEGVLVKALGPVGFARKQRVVYVLGRTRIHLDEVDGLGNFLELEYVFEDCASVSLASNTDEQRAAWTAVVELMDKLDTSRADLIGMSHIDMA